ncbi:uncharacterized protein V6R79_003447 [Siganus canaliculatus]
MPVALWCRGLLLCFLGLCACMEEECVLGVVGQPVSLPCSYPQLLSLANFSIEWRKEDEVVLRSVWRDGQNVEELGVNSATISDDAEQTGNFSLELPTVDLMEHNNQTFSFFIISEENPDTEVCSVCLRVAASFSSPQLERKDAADGKEAAFTCHSSGGFPKPSVLWFINSTEMPPEGSVWTVAQPAPDTLLYNVTSHLKVNISKASSVSCTIRNPPINESRTSTSHGTQDSPVRSRAAESIWIFSTGLCVVVGIMVVAGVVYQIHLDRISKRKKREFQHQQQEYRGYKRRHLVIEETDTVKLESKETDV